MDITTFIVTPALLSFLISLLLTPLVIKYAQVLGIVHDPQTRKHPALIHERPVPRGGGIPIFISIAATSLFFLGIEPKILGILVGGAILVFIGFLDDRKDIDPYLRLMAQFIAAGVAVAVGIKISFISNPLGEGIIYLSYPQITLNLFGHTYTIWLLSLLFGLLWIVGLMNTVNWSSGVDGQLSGFIPIAAFFIAILSLRFSADITQWPVVTLAVIVSGAYLGFLPWHMYPQKIMPGFGGATLAGYMLAVLAILATAKVGTLLMVLAVPIADALFTVIRRVSAGKSPVWADRGHLHHRLLDLGWSKQKIAYFYWGATSLLGIISLNLNAHQKFYTIIGVILLVGGVLVWLSSSKQLSRQHDQHSG